MSWAPRAAFAVFPAFGPEAWAQAKDKLVLGMSLEPPVLDPNKNAAAAIREITYQNIFESLAASIAPARSGRGSPRAGQSRPTALV